MAGQRRYGQGSPRPGVLAWLQSGRRHEVDSKGPKPDAQTATSWRAHNSSSEATPAIDDWFFDILSAPAWVAGSASRPATSRANSTTPSPGFMSSRAPSAMMPYRAPSAIMMQPFPQDFQHAERTWNSTMQGAPLSCAMSDVHERGTSPALWAMHRLSPSPSPPSPSSMIRGSPSLIFPELPVATQPTPSQEEAAYRLAAKYVGGLERLDRTARSWRHNHDASQGRRHRQREGHEAKGEPTMAPDEDVAWADTKDLLTGIASATAARVRRHDPGLSGRATVAASVAKARVAVTDEAEDAGSEHSDTSRASGIETAEDARVTFDTMPRRGSGESDASPSTRQRKPSVSNVKRNLGPLRGSPYQGPGRGGVAQAQLQGANKDATLPTQDTWASVRECTALSKCYKIPLEEVRDLRKEFLEFSSDGISLSMSELEGAIKRKLYLPPEAEIPTHILQATMRQVDTNGNQEVCFEEYVLWGRVHAFDEELCVPDLKGRMMREVARRTGVKLPDVEHISAIFDMFDVNHTGFMEFGVFVDVVMEIQAGGRWSGAKRGINTLTPLKLKQFWMELDTESAGNASFADFVMWFSKTFTRAPMPKRHAA